MIVVIRELTNIRSVAETQMVSFRKRNIQGSYNSVQHLQRRYLELPPIRVVSIVTQVIHLKARYSRQAESHSSEIVWKQRIA